MDGQQRWWEFVKSAFLVALISAEQWKKGHWVTVGMGERVWELGRGGGGRENVWQSHFGERGILTAGQHKETT